METNANKHEDSRPNLAQIRHTDGTPPTDQTPVQRLITALRSLAEPSANAPSEASQPLPEGFEWDFRDYETCACGLSNRLGLNAHAIVREFVDPCARDNPLNADEIDGLVPLYGVPARDVTPAMVADALERLVSSLPSPYDAPLMSNEDAIAVSLSGAQAEG